MELSGKIQVLATSIQTFLRHLRDRRLGGPQSVLWSSSQPTKQATNQH